MNSKERAVLIFLCATFLIGTGVSFMRNYQDKRNLEAIVIKKTTNKKITTENTENTSSINVAVAFMRQKCLINQTATTSESTLININTASKKELEALPGIGPVIAQRIVEHRQQYARFKTKEELLKVSGIGAKKFARIKDKIITE